MANEIGSPLGNIGAQLGLLKELYEPLPDTSGTHTNKSTVENLGVDNQYYTVDPGMDALTQLGKLQQASYQSFIDAHYGGGAGCCCPSAPNLADSCHPGGLKVDDKGVVTTPGGFKIEATKQHEWIITGPDGKTTRIWGDPHVEEGDGGKWDFKRNSTFVLADGTRVNVSTKPWGKDGWTVTDKLEIIAGNERVQVTGIAEGKGKAGQVTQDGFQHVNAFGNRDVFVMGKETDDWSFTGKEIIGSERQGEKFKLGNALEAGAVKPLVDHAAKNGMNRFFEELSNKITQLYGAINQANGGTLPDLGKVLDFPGVDPASRGCWGTKGDDSIQNLRGLFGSVSEMFKRLADQLALTGSIRTPYRAG